jgi:hypothetical protein
VRCASCPDLGACWPEGEARWLLQIAAAPEPQARRAWREWSAALGGRVPDLGSARLLPLITRRLLALGIGARDAERLKGVYRHTWCSNQLRLRRLGPVLEALARAGVPVLALKGLALLPSAYGGDLGLRAMLDSDLLVPPEQLGLAARTLVANGWRAQHAPTEADLCAGQPPWGEHAFPFQHDGLELDLHWHFSRIDRGPWLDAQAWQHSEALLLAGLALQAPAPTELLCLVCVHGVCWTRGRALHWPSDAALLVSSGAIDWQRLVAHATQRLLTLPVYDALRFVRSALCAPVPPGVLDQLGETPVSLHEQCEYRALTSGARALSFDRLHAAQLAGLRARTPGTLRAGLSGLETR